MRAGTAHFFLTLGVLAAGAWPAAPVRAQGAAASAGAQAAAPALPSAMPSTVPPMAKSSAGAIAREATFPDPLPIYPSGSIRNVEQSKAAVNAALTARKQQEVRFDAQKKECYKKFFAEQCLVKVREEDYKINSRINAVELEAHAFERSNNAELHEKDRADREARRQAKDVRQQPEREEKSAGRKRKQEDKERQNADFQAKAGERAQQAAESTKREQERRADLAKKAAQAKAEANERAQRAIDEKARVDEALKRAAEREAKQKEKEKGRLERAQRGDAPKTPDLPGPPGAEGRPATGAKS